MARFLMSHTKKIWLMILAGGAAGAALALVVAQAMLLHISSARLDDYAYDVLRKAQDVVTSSRQAFEQIQAIDALPCSDADLRELRFIMINAEYVGDIGRAANGMLLCSARWGRLPFAAKIPPAQSRRSDGTEFWRAMPSLTEKRLRIDMTRRGDALIVTAPTAYKSFLKEKTHFAALLVERSGSYVFQSFGKTEGLLQRLHAPNPWSYTEGMLAHTRCADSVQLCVVASLSGISILNSGLWAMLAIAGLGALTGGSLSFGLANYQRSRSSLPQQIRRAVLEGRLFMVYQPLVHLRAQQMQGVEALARLTDERATPIAPDVFIRIAEESELIGTITRIVIRQSLTEMCQRLLDNPAFYLSINLSASDVTDAALCDFLLQEVRQRGISPAQIVLELTENTRADHDALIEAMRSFKSHGFRFFIDDFGTGYSSLAYLSRLPIDGIKIDRMFTQAIGKEAVSSVIVEKICSLTKELQVKLVVEGIETEEQARHVLALNPDVIGQGWLLGRPVAAQQLPA